MHSAYEAGFCGFHLHRCLVKSDIQSIVVHPAAIETAANNRVKTDKRDSLKIASQLADGRLKGIYVPEEEQLDNREVTRFRETLVRQRVAEGNRIKSFLMRNGSIEIDSDRRLCPTFLKELQKLKLTEGRQYVLKRMIDHWLYFHKQIKEIEKQLEKQAEQEVPEVQRILESVPGIGLLGSRILANELGDMSQFSSAKQLYSFTGLTPSEHSSGETRRQGKITRQGRSILRKILTQAAWKAITADKQLEALFLEIAKRAGKQRAIIGIARRLIGRIRACLRTGISYKFQEA